VDRQRRNHVGDAIALDLRGDTARNPPRDNEAERDRDQHPPPATSGGLFQGLEPLTNTVDYQNQGSGPESHPDADDGGQSQEPSRVSISEGFDTRELAPATDHFPHVATLKTC
jgi:hypothetical protein